MAAVRKSVLLGLRDVAVEGCPKGPAAWTASKLGGVPVSAAAKPLRRPWRGRWGGCSSGGNGVSPRGLSSCPALQDALPAVTTPGPLCDHCAQPLPLVVQVYCPLEGSPFHRLLYVFACARQGCGDSQTRR